MTAQEWLNVLAILESIDEVPGMPGSGDLIEEIYASRAARQQSFRINPVRFLRHADHDSRAAIWAEVERRMRGGA